MLTYRRVSQGARRETDVTGRIPFASTFKRWANVYDLDWRLLAAHAQVESNYNPDAVNKLDNESIGLMQILCVPDGNGGCKNPLNITGWSTMTREKLFDVDENVRIASAILSENIQRKGWPRGSAMYNAYSARLASKDGPFPNQSYVDKIVKAYDAIKRDNPL